MINKHDLYTDSDEDVPQAICDSNGSVALGLCKKCNRAESELDEPCLKTHRFMSGNVYQYPSNFESILFWYFSRRSLLELNDSHRDELVSLFIPDAQNIVNHGLEALKNQLDCVTNELLADVSFSIRDRLEYLGTLKQFKKDSDASLGIDLHSHYQELFYGELIEKRDTVILEAIRQVLFDASGGPGWKINVVTTLI